MGRSMDYNYRFRNKPLHLRLLIFDKDTKTTEWGKDIQQMMPGNFNILI